MTTNNKTQRRLRVASGALALAVLMGAGLPVASAAESTPTVEQQIQTVRDWDSGSTGWAQSTTERRVWVDDKSTAALAKTGLALDTDAMTADLRAADARMRAGDGIQSIPLRVKVVDLAKLLASPYAKRFDLSDPSRVTLDLHMSSAGVLQERENLRLDSVGGDRLYYAAGDRTRLFSDADWSWEQTFYDNQFVMSQRTNLLDPNAEPLSIGITPVAYTSDGSIGTQVTDQGAQSDYPTTVVQDVFAPTPQRTADLAQEGQRDISGWTVNDCTTAAADCGIVIQPHLSAPDATDGVVRTKVALTDPIMLHVTGTTHRTVPATKAAPVRGTSTDEDGAAVQFSGYVEPENLASQSDFWDATTPFDDRIGGGRAASGQDAEGHTEHTYYDEDSRQPVALYDAPAYWAVIFETAPEPVEEQPTPDPVIPSPTPTDTPTPDPVLPSPTPTEKPVTDPVIPTPSETPTPTAKPTPDPVIPTPTSTPTPEPVIPSPTPTEKPVADPVLPSTLPSDTPAPTPAVVEQGAKSTVTVQEEQQGVTPTVHTGYTVDGEQQSASPSPAPTDPQQMMRESMSSSAVALSIIGGGLLLAGVAVLVAARVVSRRRSS